MEVQSLRYSLPSSWIQIQSSFPQTLAVVEDMLESSSAGESEITPPRPAASARAPEKQPPSVDEVDSFPMKCGECGIAKKTVKGLKMHIKLMHLRTGRRVHLISTL